MIRRIRHRGLRELYERGSVRGVDPRHVGRLRLILNALDQAGGPEDIRLLGMGFHSLSGNLAGHYAVRVSGNWRVIFRFDDGHATAIDYVDYH